MKKIMLPLLAILFAPSLLLAQQNLTPEMLWKLGRVSGLGISKDAQSLLYAVSTPNVAENKSIRKTYSLPLAGGQATEISNAASLLPDDRISPDGKFKISAKDVKMQPVQGSDFYPALTKSNVQIYDQLNYRHWDTWEDGAYSHIFVSAIGSDSAKDIMAGEKFDAPQKPFGGDEDFIWSPDSKKILYVSKKKYGTAYAISTNTDLYEYDLASGATKNITEGMMGYDLEPSYNSKGELAWLSMKRDGYESDKQDIVVFDGNTKMNLTAQRDDIHVSGFVWGKDGRQLYFWAPINGTQQLFEVNYPGRTRIAVNIRQVTNGDFDITGIVGQVGNDLYVTRTDHNHAAEIFKVDLANGNMQQRTHVNDTAYAGIGQSKSERRFVKTSDGKQMLVWVIYPPDFDPSKKYPTLLYCQGGPQSALTQTYSFRWNFQLMAAQGYIVVAPNRRGMPGHGTKWNEQISGDHGGQAIKDYLSAIDALSKESFVDNDRLGCVGASYGGYSAFMLAGVHKNRFKTFIAHDGIFDMRSMYGSTEELWFVNKDYAGAYWDSKNKAAMRTYKKHSPSNFVSKWNTPMLIFQGGKDYRVPTEQSLQAFQALQLKGIKSKLVYLPDENHWVIQAQNAQVWQGEFYKWLKETL